MTENTPSPLGNVISIDDERIKNHLDRVVRGTVDGDVERAFGCRSGPAVQCAALWNAVKPGRRHQSRPL